MSAPSRVGLRWAFTLVEMLVSLAVLLLLVAFIGQIVALTGRAISVNASKLDAAAQARLFFDRLGTDLSARPRRSDLGMALTKTSGSDSFQFYSQVNGYTGVRRVTAVGYRIPTVAPGPFFQLQRGATGTDWTAPAGASPSPSPSPSFVLFAPLSPPVPRDADYEVLADGIFRFECCYLLDTGARSNTARADLSNVTALVATVAVLPSSDRVLVSNDQLQQLSTILPDSTEGTDPTMGTLAAWNTLMPQAALAIRMPPAAVQNIRLYEHTFHVP